MAYHLHWLHPGQLALIVSWGAISAEEIQAFDREAMGLLDGVTAPLAHAIYDYTQVTSLPPLRDYLTMKAAQHPKVGWTLVVGLEHPIMRFIFLTMGQVFRLRLRMFHTTSEALAFIYDIDRTLPPLPADLDLTALRDRLILSGGSAV